MDFSVPADIQATLDALDAFIEKESVPLQAADDNERFFDHRREWARTDFDNGGVPRAEWEELLREMRRRADAAGWLRLALPAEFGGRTVGEVLLTPTRLYARAVKAVLGHDRVKQVVHGIAHITGGGLAENLGRIVPDHVQVAIDRGSWAIPPVFPWIQGLGGIAADEMDRVFNMGVGMVLVVSPHFADSIQQQLSDLGFRNARIGTVRAAAAEDERVVLT